MERKIMLLWSKGNAKRYYVTGGKEVQIGRYRGLDKFDRHMKTKPTWHGKWYVDVFGNKVRLFNTQKQARDYLKKYFKSQIKRMKK